MKLKVTAAALAVILIFTPSAYVFALSPSQPERQSYEYKGEGTVIAVLDGGFNLNHYLFKLPENAEVRLDKSSVTALLESTSLSGADKNTVKKTYISDKIPFAFDYTAGGVSSGVDSAVSAGTQTAGIIGAYAMDKEAGFSGIAPAAQLLLMKVSSGESDSGAIDGKTAAAAMSDAIVLGADVIFINTTDSPRLAEDEDFINAAAAARNAGVPVFAGAGSGGLAGADSIYDIVYGISAPETSNADYGTQNDFSKIPSLITVASADDPLNNVFSFVLGKIPSGAEEESGISENTIDFSDTNLTYRTAGGKTFARRFMGRELEYVEIGGTGTKEDFAELAQEVPGKIALVARGDITFAEKMANAAEYGAEAVIVYESNPAEKTKIMMNIEGSEIPGIFISYEDGQKLLASDEKIISFPSPDPDVIEISGYSSTGATNILTIGPDFVSEGNFVEAAFGDSEIDTVGGDTRYSAAKAAGIYACVKGYLVSSGKTAKTGKELCDTVLLLMSSAAVPAAGETGTEISPRIQGAGRADVYASAQADAVIYNTVTKEGKTETGENIKLFQKQKNGGDFATLFITVENISDKKLSYDLSVSVLTDKAVTFERDELLSGGDAFYEITGVSSEVLTGSGTGEPLPYFITGESESIPSASVTAGDFDRHLNVNSDSFKAKRVTLRAGQKAEIEITISLGESTLKKYSAIFENGFFVEGYVYLTPSDGIGQEISHPYMGFCGDWSASPIAGEKIYDSSVSFFGNNMLVANIDGAYYRGAVVLGQNYLSSVDYDSGASAEILAAISPYITFGGGEYGYPSGLCWAVSPLRDISSHTVTVKSLETGKIVHRQNLGAIKKSAGEKNGLAVQHVEQLWSCTAPDNGAYVYPDGRYLCEITLYSNTPDRFSQTVLFEFSIDTAPPELAGMKVTESGGKKYLEVTAKDENFVQAVFVNDGYYDFLCDDSPLKPKAVSENGKGGEVTLSFDISLFLNLAENGNAENYSPYIYVEIADYAHNSSAYRFSYEEIRRLQ